MNIEQLTTFFGWVSVINIAYLLLATLTMTLMKQTIIAIHSKMLAVDEKDLPALYFKFLSNYKIATLVFCVAPYIALKLMSI